MTIQSVQFLQSKTQLDGAPLISADEAADLLRPSDEAVCWPASPVTIPYRAFDAARRVLNSGNVGYAHCTLEPTAMPRRK